MNKKEKPSLLKGKGAAVGIVFCFVAVIALVGVYTFNGYRSQIEDQVAKSEMQKENLTEENAEETTTEDILLPESQNGTSEDADDMAEIRDTEEAENDENIEETAGEATGQESAPSVWFQEDSILTWPASGAVIMGYSMDQTVFFQTLEQYQYNPALIIAGEPGETIAASAAGIVTNIENTAETGTTVSMDMGNGYEVVYGQLQDVPLSVGDYVNVGETVGILAEPTKYYSVEGPNLYFEVLKDGEPVDPMNYME